jgi:hypothetical protein
MVYRALVAAAYVAVAFYFLRSYRPHPTLFGMVVSILWPVTLAVAIGSLVTLDDDALMF